MEGGWKGGGRGEKEKQEDISLLADQKPIIRGIPLARGKRDPYLSQKNICYAPVQNEGHSVEFQDLSVQLAR